mmetsp:Transcript_67888/g.181536  ORF Transcript_67888/g.181536 Transcript_67888/m.181536 type:complete len:187 (+) Transcript_67888:38-598(+)
MCHNNISATQLEQAICDNQPTQSSSSLKRSRAFKPRAVLSRRQVEDIFRIKLQASQSPGSKLSPLRVAKLYGVSEKTIRDIWKGRTWTQETKEVETCPSEEGSCIFVRTQSCESSECGEYCSDAASHSDNDVCVPIPQGAAFGVSLSHRCVDEQLFLWSSGKVSLQALPDPFEAEWEPLRNWSIKY